MKKSVLTSCGFLFTIVLLWAAPLKTADPKREEIARKIVKNMVDDKFEDARVAFAYSLKQGLSAQQMQQAWSGLLVQIGEFQNVISATDAQTQGYNQILVRCKFARENATVEVTFNEDNKVIGLYLKP